MATTASILARATTWITGMPEGLSPHYEKSNGTPSSKEIHLDENGATSLEGRCSLNWQDYVILSAMVLTVCAAAFAFITSQTMLGFALLLIFAVECFAEYYIYQFADYKEMKERVHELSLEVSRFGQGVLQFETTEKRFEEEVAALQKEKGAFQASNVALKGEVATFQTSNEELRAFFTEYQRTEAALYEKKIALVEENAQIAARLELGATRYEELSQELTQIKEQIAEETRRLAETSQKIHAVVDQRLIPIARRIGAGIAPQDVSTVTRELQRVGEAIDQITTPVKIVIVP